MDTTSGAYLTHPGAIHLVVALGLLRWRWMATSQRCPTAKLLLNIDWRCIIHERTFSNAITRTVSAQSCVFPWCNHLWNRRMGGVQTGQKDIQCDADVDWCRVDAVPLCHL